MPMTGHPHPKHGFLLKITFDRPGVFWSVMGFSDVIYIVKWRGGTDFAPSVP